MKKKIKLKLKTFKEFYKIYKFYNYMKLHNPMSQLTWVDTKTSNLKKENHIFFKKVLSYLNFAFSLNLIFDKNLKPDPKRRYEYEYINANKFPGEHYKLLTAIVKVENFNNFLEIGTGSGLASKFILNNSDCTIHTFDILPWDENNSHITEDEFKNDKFNYYVKNILEQENLDNFHVLLNKSELIFLDANKDGIFEDLFLTNLSKNKFDKRFRLLVIDDIRYFSMYKIWNKINSPKIDLTSFGHWSGTGIVDISNGLEY